MSAVYLGRSSLLGDEVYQLQTGGHVFQATLPKGQSSVGEVETGSLVRLEGVCRTIEDHNKKSLNPEFELLLSSAHDLTVIQRPDWWNLRRILWIGGIFLGTVVIAGLWIGMIWRKNRLLKLAQAELQEANEGLEERGRTRT